MSFQHRPCSTIILLPEEVFQQFLSFIILPKVVHSSYFQKQVFYQFLLHLAIFTSSYFRKKYIHPTSERSPSTILIIHLTFERRAFILLPKEVFQWFLSFIKLPKEVNSSYLRNRSSNNSYFRKKSYNIPYSSSHFRKKYVHLTSESSLSTILIVLINITGKFYNIANPKSLPLILNKKGWERRANFKCDTSKHELESPNGIVGLSRATRAFSASTESCRASLWI